jgi:uncharacterized membrane protein HdeD (DUF308 family)
MTPLALFAGVVLVAGVATYCYAFRYRETNVLVSSGVAQLAWGIAAIRGGSLAYSCGEGCRRTLSGDSVQLLALALFALSGLVFMLAHWSVYPPGSEGGRGPDAVGGNR